jgi:hypothetical protein
MTAPGIHAAQLVYLVLEAMGVTWQDRGAPDVEGLYLILMMLGNAQGQREVGAPASVAEQQYAQGCVQHIWLGLGKQLLQASGVPDAKLEGDGSQAASTGASSSSRHQQESTSMPGDAAARLHRVCEEYSKVLFAAMSYYDSEWCNAHICLICQQRSLSNSTSTNATPKMQPQQCNPSNATSTMQPQQRNPSNAASAMQTQQCSLSNATSATQSQQTQPQQCNLSNAIPTTQPQQCNHNNAASGMQSQQCNLNNATSTMQHQQCIYVEGLCKHLHMCP